MEFRKKIDKNWMFGSLWGLFLSISATFGFSIFTYAQVEDDAGLSKQQSLSPSIDLYGRVHVGMIANFTDKKYGFDLYRAKLGVDGTLLPFLGYTIGIQSQGQEVTLDVAEMRFRSSADRKNVSGGLSLGAIYDTLIREWKSGGKYLFNNASPLIGLGGYDDRLLGLSLDVHALQDKFHVWWFFGNASNALESSLDTNFTSGFRLEFDAMRPWKHGEEWFESDMNFTVGLGAKYSYGFQQGDVELKNAIWSTLDFGFSAAFFYTQVFVNMGWAQEVSNEEGQFYFGVNSDFAFAVSQWFVPALRVYYSRGHGDGYTFGTATLGKGQELGLNVVTNFYPGKSRHVFKVQPEFGIKLIKDNEDGSANGMKGIFFQIGSIVNF